MNVIKSFDDTMRYHERKVQRLVAECLYAGNMLKTADLLTIKEKKYHLRRLQSLNDRVIDKTVHIFLSWHPDDVPDKEKIRAIVREYMREMALHRQPYLVYLHRDTPHLHVHIVTTNIRHDGSKINIWEGERWHSQQVCRQLEKKYGLYQAGTTITDAEWRKKHPVQKVVYGVTPLKPTINAILEDILPSYRYTSLDELNAVLRPYHVKAYQGREDSVTRQHNGLLYYPLNQQGNVEATYVKSSALRSKPTLTKLQERFRENAALREEHRQRLTTTIDWIFYKQPVSMEALRQALQKEKIIMVEQENSQDQRQIYYVDQLAKVAWDGNSLGQKYSAEGISNRVISTETYQQQKQQAIQQQKQGPKQRLRQRLRPDQF